MKRVNIFLGIFILMVSDNSLAQLCQGSLGDPVVNISFGSGTGFGTPLSTKTTFYNYIQAGCPDDGFYTIVNHSYSCFGNTWHNITKDHTGDPNGFFMLVNASFEPGDFFVDTVYGLCHNSTFEFAAWIMNVVNSSACGGSAIEPNLTFFIETTAGLRLDSLNTGDIPIDNSPIWKQYGFYFKTPPDVNDVVVRIRNNALGGCGNDLALDDITFRPCGPLLNASILGGSRTIDLCEDDINSFSLQGTVSQGYTSPSLQWQSSMDSVIWTDIPGATTTVYKRLPSLSGSYYYRMTAAESGNINALNCRVVSNTISFHVYAKPALHATSNSPVCEGTMLTLTETNGNTYEWQGPANFSSTGSTVTIYNVGLESAGKYYVDVVSNGGCRQNDSVDVAVLPKPAASAGADTTICAGNSFILHGNGGDSYIWQPSTGLSSSGIPDPIATPLDSISYILKVSSNTSGCSDEDTVIVNVLQPPGVNAGADKTIMEGDKTSLAGTVGGTNVHYYWTPDLFISNIDSLQPVVSPPHDITYTLHVESLVGCGDVEDQAYVKVFRKVGIPNAFSPNNDGINDLWQLSGIEAYPEVDVTVFNRYGQPVFSSRGYGRPWDGKYNNKLLSVGIYYYVIDRKFGLPRLTGWVTILR